MAVTVTTDNYTELSTCDSDSAGGSWSGGNSLTTETDFYKYSSACLAYTTRQVNTYQLDFSPTTAVDLSGTNSTIVRLWFLSYQQFAAQASDGIRFYITDGNNTAYWNVLGGDTYPGGWYMIVVDVSTTPTSGTKPTMTAVTGIGIDCTTTGTTKNAPSTYIDHLHLMDGLVAYGDNGTGVPFDMSDIYDADNTTSTAWGVVKPVNTVWFLNSSIEIGHAAGATATTYEENDELFVYDGSFVTNFYLSAVEGTGATTFDLSRCNYTSSSEPLIMDFSDADVPVSISGCSIVTADLIDMSDAQTLTGTVMNSIAASTIDNDVENSTWNTSGLITLTSTGSLTGCVINESTGSASVGTADLELVDECTINSDGSNHAVELSSIGAGSMVWSNVTTGYDSGGAGGSPVTPTSTGNEDIYVNVGSGTLTINVAPGATIPSVRSAGAVVNVVAGSITLKFIVKDNTQTEVVGAYAYIDDNNSTPFILNTTTDVNGEASVSHSAGAVLGSTWRIRKYGYKPFIQTVDIGGINITLPVTLIVDPQQT